MLEKPKRVKQLNNQDRQLPATIQELINRYDLENKDIYKFLNYLVDSINENKSEVIDNLESESQYDALSANQGRVLNEKFSKNIITTHLSQKYFDLSERDQTIPLDVSNVTGNKLSLNNNAVKIGKGVSKVLISGIIFYEGYGTETAYLFPRIKINGTPIVKAIASRCVDTVRYQSVTFAPFLMSVNEGDLITLTSGDNSESTIRGYDNGSLCTYMTVEVIE